ncbi:MAG TPA: DGQHR domain-containing protein [Candidatus Methylomirabilis sp.]|jgi:DGQHR domain-containing protein|nr:DGQHR domain-containing protein [Candidatus Methylomirabilis sp.]
MISVPAHRIRQFGVEFYQAVFSAADIDRLVRFEVLGYGGAGAVPGASRRGARATQINWEVLEKRIGQSEAAYQRPVIRRKIQELLQYYRECREAGNLPAIPGAVIMISEKRLTFKPVGSAPTLGQLQIPEEPGVLRALDGQHRLLALHAAVEQEALDLHVPAVLFDMLDARQVVELFVTINAKHTRLNPSHLLSLAGRRLYANPHQALAHDIIRHLNEAEDSPLRGDIRMLGVGKGRVTQAALNEEMVDLFEVLQKVGGEAKIREMQHQGKRFFLNYLKGVAQAFPKAWAGKKYSIKTGAALRAFVRVSPEVMARARDLKGDSFDAHGLRQAVAPWGERLTDRRFETEGEWRSKLAGGTRGTVDLLARELKDALRRG